MLTQSPLPQTFACNQCGQCCTSVSIPIEPEKAKALKQLNWVVERLAQYGVDFGPLPNVKHDSRWQVPLTVDRRCVFLGDANECLVHHLAGPELKPDECHRYPFSSGFREPNNENSPSVLYYDVTASCQSVAEGLVSGVVQWQPSSHLPLHPQGIDELPSQWPITPRYFLPWEEREAWLQALRPLITDDSVTAWQLLQVAAKLFHPIPSSTPVADTFLEGLWLILCLRKPYSLWSVACLLWNGPYTDDKVLGPQAVKLSAVLAFPINDASTVLKAFVVSILSRRLPYASGMDARGLWWLAFSGWVLVRFYTRALGLLESSPKTPKTKVQALDDSLVVVAIRLVDRYYTGHQPRFVAWVHRRSCQSWLLGVLSWPVKLGRLNKVFSS